MIRSTLRNRIIIIFTILIRILQPIFPTGYVKLILKERGPRRIIYLLIHRQSGILLLKSSFYVYFDGFLIKLMIVSSFIARIGYALLLQVFFGCIIFDDRIVIAAVLAAFVNVQFL